MTQPGLQYPNGSNLGILRSNDNYYIPVTVPNSSPQSGPITYSLINATSSSTQLPPNLRLDSSSGYIYGRVPPQIEYLKEYSLTIQASGSIPTTSTVYSLGITSVNPDAITWVSSSTLSINQGLISELSILATHTETQSILEYGFASTTAIFLGGFTLTNTGNIVGQATTPGIFTATVVAFPVINLDGGPANQPHDLTVSGGSAVSVYEGDELETVTKSVTTTYESIITGGTSLVSGTVTLDGGSATLVGTTVTDGGNVSSTFIVTTTIQETVTVVVTSPTGALLDGGTVSSTYNSTASGGTSKLKFIEIPHDTDGGASASIHNTINDPDTDGGSSISVYEFGNIVDGGDTNSSYTYYDTCLLYTSDAADE